MNYDCLPDSIEILEWPAFRKCYQKVSRFPANLKKIISSYIDDDDDDENNKINKIIKYFENAHFIIKDYFDYIIEFQNRL